MATVIKLKRSETPNQLPSAGALEIGELAMNLTDGKLFSKTTGGAIKEVGGAGATSLQSVTNGGAVTDNDITLNGSNLIFEGYLENAYETTLTAVEPTGDRTIYLPNSDGQVAMDGDALAYSIVFGS